MKLDISGGFYESQSKVLSSQQLINAYVQTPQTESAYSEDVIFGTPGLVEVDSLGTSSALRNYGAVSVGGVPFFVQGNSNGDDGNLFSLDASEALSSALGTLVDLDTRFVSMTQNGTQLMMLIPGGTGYIWDTSTSAFTEITDSDFTFREPQYVTFIDGFFVCSTALDSLGNPGSKQFIISDINDGLSWDALQFGSAEANPDDIVAPWEFKDRLYIFGEFTYEPFSNIGGADFPFQRVPGGLQNIGLSSPFSLVNSNSYFYWIGPGTNEKVGIWRANGQAPEKISTPAIDFHIQQFTEDELADVYSVYEGVNGNYFIVFHFSTGAFGYNETNGKWHERQTARTQHRVSSLAGAYGNLYVGDIFDGRIGKVDTEVFSEYDDTAVLRTLVTAPFNMDQEPFFVPRLELTMDTSDYPDSEEGVEIINLSISHDGATTFGPPDPALLGPLVDFGRRVGWRRKGRFARSAVFKFEFSLDFPFIMVRLDGKIKPGIPVFSE